MLFIRANRQLIPYPTVEELAKTLSESYRGDHVSIQFKRKGSDLDAVHFVSVNDNGEVFHSYGTGEAYNFEQLKNIAVISSHDALFGAANQ